MKHINIIIIFFLCIICNKTIGQSFEINQAKEDLLKLVNTMKSGETDSIRINANNQFKILLNTILKTNKSYLYQFPNMNPITIIQPKDKSFKLFTWAIPKKDGTYEYSGLIQKCKKNGKKCHIYWLEKSDFLKNNIYTSQLTTDEWYGCIYYDVIPIKINKTTYYTLLGWDGNNTQTTKKIIDVLKIEKNQDPIFGAKIFNNDQVRFFIEYASQYPVSLQYDQELEYIVFDHLEPLDGISKNNYSLYVTNLSYDIFKKTRLGWELEENIYLNNKE